MNELMLASRGSVSDIGRWQRAGYLFDLKIDGVRCLATVVDGVVTLNSRTSVDITSQYPDVVSVLHAAYPNGHVVLDGEICVLGDDGFPSWPRTHKRNAQQSGMAKWVKSLPARFYAFDMLTFGGEDMTTWAYANRRQVLELHAQEWPDALQSTPTSTDGEVLWRLVEQHRLEGMIAKRPAGRYRGGRSPDWVKIKRKSTVSCLVGGFDPGTGHRSQTFGNLHLYLLADGALIPVGKVGSGFSDREISEVMQRLHQPPLIVEVEYMDLSPDGVLRQPVFKHIRNDLGVQDCTTEQLVDLQGGRT